jgi:hypothetical protein
MNLEDIMAFTGVLLSIDTPQAVKDRYFLVLVRELARENRKAAEARGIGKDTRLRMPEPPDEILCYAPVMNWQAFEGLRREMSIYE